MYLGSVSETAVDRFVLGEWKTARYVPALNKMIDEILDNCIDEAIRTKFKHGNKISVTIGNTTATISDNGRGIPQDTILDAEGKKILRPVAAWAHVNAGTSFDDSRTTIGANGVGSACVNFMSTKFVGTTVSKHSKVVLTSMNGGDMINVEHSKTLASAGTSVQFTPDFSLLDTDNFTSLDTIQLVADRLAGLQIAFPEIKFKFNGKLVGSSTLKKYAKMFAGDASIVATQSDSLGFFFCSSVDGFRSTSYINGVNTRLGGAFNDYIANNVVDELIKMIKRRHKIVVAKSTIKSGLTFVLFARNFVNPTYDSQTKERLTNSVSSVRAHFDAADVMSFTQCAKKILDCADIIDPIIEAQLAKKQAADKRAATLAQKKLRKVKVAKHIAASKPGGTLFICEGDSAMGFLLKVRDAATVGGFPLRGVIMNTWDLKPADVLKNKELSELIAVLGLDINNPESVANMEYKNVATLADADMDGNHISGLLIAFLYKYWPKLFSNNQVHVTKTPIMISTKRNDVKWFYNLGKANTFKQTSTGWHHRYIKGLASLTEAEYDSIINKPVLNTIDIDNPELLELMFGKDSQLRKDWLRS
jgi:DNA topoisomerase-2